MADSSNDGSGTPLITDGGIVYSDPSPVRRRLRVAPTVADVSNTVALETWPTPTACVRLDYSRFAFDSSFPHPSVSTELASLFSLRAPGVTDADKLAVFGHADPIGEEAYNKTLGGRRAKAVYGLLTRQPALWDELHQGAFEGDRWGAQSLQTCLTQLGYDVGAIDGKAGPLFRAGMRAFKKDNGLPEDDTVDKDTRVALFGKYIDALTADEGGTGRAYDPTDFVGEAREGDFRGAFQGCGERNLAMVLSQDETNDLAPENKRDELIRTQRPNRRVLIFLFRPADVKKMTLWPCPTASAGPDGCAKVAWSNKDDRLAPADRRREIRRGGKTFGCKFYDSVARLSPCETVRGRVRIWLLDQNHQRMPNAPYRLKIASLVREGAANDDGLLVEEEVPLGPTAFLEWGAKPADPPPPAESGAQGNDTPPPSGGGGQEDESAPPSGSVDPDDDAPPSGDDAQDDDAAPPSGSGGQNDDAPPSGAGGKDTAAASPPTGSGGRPILAFAVDAPAGSTAAAGDEPAPDSPLGTLFRAIRDGQFPLYAGLLPESSSPYSARKGVALSAESAVAKTADQEAQQDAIRTQNLSLQPADPSTPVAEQPFAKTYGDADLKNVHVNGLPAGGATPEGRAVAADATVAPPSCEPLEQPIRDVLAAAPNRAPTRFGNSSTYEQTITKIPAPPPPPKGTPATPAPKYETNLYAFPLLDKWPLPVPPAPGPNANKKLDTSTTSPLMETRQGFSKNFGNALEVVTCKLFSAFLKDPTVTDTSPKAFFAWAMIGEPHSGVRSGVGDLHVSGSAVDINASTNPWLPVRSATRRGGELHTAGLQVSPSKVATPLGVTLTTTYGIGLDAAITRFNDENVWTPCCAAIDDACRTYTGAAADLSDRKSKESSRACFTRLALASAALVRYTSLAYGPRQSLSKPLSEATLHGPLLTYTLLDPTALARLAIGDVLRGYTTSSSDLASLLSHVKPLSDVDRSNETLVKAKTDEAVGQLTAAQQSGLADLQSKAALAHVVLRRGMVHGSLSFFPDRKAADEACHKQSNPKAPPANWTVFDTTVPGVFGMAANWRDPRVGFLNLRVELVEAFDDASKDLYGLTALEGHGAPGKPRLRWGAVDLDMGGGCSGDLMHFDFGVHDPGVPVDANLAAWRGLQDERRLANTAQVKVHAALVAAKTSHESATKTLAQVATGLAKVKTPDPVPDLHARIDALARRLSAVSPGCVGRIEDTRASLDQSDTREYDAVFDAGTTDGPTAQPHRKAIEAMIDPATTTQKNAASASALSTGLLQVEGQAAALKTIGDERYKRVDDALSKLEARCGKLEDAI